MSSTLSDTTRDTSTATGTGTPPARRRPSLLPYALLVPAVLALTVALGYPLVRQVVLSLQDYGLAQQFGQPPEWVGANNYRRLVADGYLWRVTFRSIAFCLVNAALTMAIGVGLALLMRHMSRGVRLLVQTGLLLAWAMPVVASLTVWQWLFDTQYGVVNYVLTGFGRFDVIVGADAASRATLVDTIELVRAMPDVLELEAWQHLAIVKESYAVDLAAAAAADGAGTR